MKVIKSIGLVIIIIICFNSCFSSFFSDSEEGLIIMSRPHTTMVEFRNNRDENNGHPVSVYQTSSKADKPVVINARSRSIPISIEPDTQQIFYFSYHLLIGGIDIPYDLPHKYGLGQTMVTIRRNELNTVRIPSIRDRMNNHDLLNEYDLPLVKDTYFSIKNDSGDSIYFVVGSQRQPFYNETELNIHNDEATQIYKLNEGQFDSVKTPQTGIQRIGNFNIISFSSLDIKNGYFYELLYSGGSNISIISSTPINIANTSVPVTKNDIIFDSNGGIGVIPDSMLQQVVGLDIILPSAPGLSRTGARFGGWNTKADGSGINYYSGDEFAVYDEDENGNPTGPITFYARWLPNIDTPVLSAIAAGQSTINLSWNAVEGAHGYWIYLYSSASAHQDTFVERRQVTEGATISFTGLSHSTPYYFRVSAYNEIGEGELSEVASATTSQGSSYQATNLAINSWFQGTINAGQTMYFRIQLVAGNTYTIEWKDWDSTSNNNWADVGAGLIWESGGTFVVPIEDRWQTNRFTFNCTTTGAYLIAVEEIYGERGWFDVRYY